MTAWFMDDVDSIASFSGDLSSMTAPPFILSPVSLTEYPCKSLFVLVPCLALLYFLWALLIVLLLTFLCDATLT